MQHDRTNGFPFFCLALLLLVPATLRAATINVPHDFPTIHQAVDASSPGDIVLVGPGHWTDRTLYDDPVRGRTNSHGMIHHDLTVRSTHGPELTTLSSSGIALGRSTALSSSAAGVVADITIEGFAFTGSWNRILDLDTAGRVTVRGCHFHDTVTTENRLWQQDPSHPAIYCPSADLVLQNCRFERMAYLADTVNDFGWWALDCANLDASGCHFEDVSYRHLVFVQADESSIRLEDCTFLHMQLLSWADTVEMIRCTLDDCQRSLRGSRLLYRDCTFRNIVSTSELLTIQVWVQGTIERCTFENLTLGRAVISTLRGGDLTITDSVFRDIRISGGPLLLFWMGAWSGDPTPSQQGCILRRNQFINNWGRSAIVLRVLAHELPVRFENNSFINNTHSRLIDFESTQWNLPSTGTIRNNLFVGNTGAVLVGLDPTLQTLETLCNGVFNNDVDTLPGEGNILADPLFCAGTYTLSAASPFAEGNSACGHIGAGGVGCPGPTAHPARTALVSRSWGSVKAGYRLE